MPVFSSEEHRTNWKRQKQQTDEGSTNARHVTQCGVPITVKQMDRG